MARKPVNRHHVGDVDLDEVDTFSTNQEKVLLESAGQYGSRTNEEESSDEEVLGIERDEDESDDDDDEEEEEEEEMEDEKGEEDVKGWGSKKAYYGGDDASDDEDSKQMTEEAMRQQKQHLQELAMDDYIDEDVMDEWKKTAEEFDEKTVAKSQFMLNKDSSIHQLDDKERMEVLSQLFPEFVPLLQELTVLRPQLDELEQHTSGVREIIEIKRVALAAYLGSIASYFAIFVDNLTGGDTFTTMKDSPVMETILTSREVWRQAGELREDVREAERTVEEIDLGHEVPLDIGDEFKSDESDSSSNSEFVDARDGEESEAEVLDLDIDISTRRNIKEVSRKQVGTEIDDVDLEDKQRRKKTLRFYTSKIDQAQQKNADRYSGDLDLPYRERLFERQQRLIEEARKKGLGQDKAQLGDDLGQGEDEDFEENDPSSADADVEYYNSLQKSGKDKKKLRTEAHQLAVQAAKEGKLEEVQERLGKDGKRAINYQILKNKGLTPHRKKENRNSRVKKRTQYEKAKKKLKSVRQVYTGDSGPYQGEKTGIKKGLSRSVKLV